eukprot:4961820-Pleurochrysis_carterae.AAC.1
MDCEKYVPSGSFYRAALVPLLLHVPRCCPAPVGATLCCHELARASAVSSAGSAALRESCGAREVWVSELR